MQCTAATMQETARFWQSFSKALLEILGIDFQPWVHIAIFGINADAIQLTPRQVIAFVFLLAWRRILLLWKLRKPPQLSPWLSDVIGKELKWTLKCRSTWQASEGDASRFVSQCEELIFESSTVIPLYHGFYMLLPILICPEALK